MEHHEHCDVVIVEDSIASGTLFASYLETAGLKARLFIRGQDALDYIRNTPPKVLLLDVQLPDMNGLELLAFIRERELPTSVVVITAHGSVDIAVDSMRGGAFDFIEKPFTKDRLLVTVANAMQRQDLEATVQIYREEIDRSRFSGFIGRSLSMQVVYRIIESAASSKATVFITGESGTGKELCAEAIHEHSGRADAPFVALNCAAIPKELFESEIFGHTKGAFSGATADRKGAAETADGGTLFLDEICEMDPLLQAKLLRFIQTGTFTPVGGNVPRTVDVRFVCATNRDPMAEVAAGNFREDLYYRLNVVPIQLPPLRDRDNDVVDIAETFLQAFAADEGKTFCAFDNEVKDKLLNFDWPGNVRELQNVIKNIVILNDGSRVSLGMLPESFGPSMRADKAVTRGNVRDPAADHRAQLTGADGIQDIEPLWQIERNHIESAIAKCEDNIPVAAAFLGVSASTVYRKLKTWQETDRRSQVPSTPHEAGDELQRQYADRS